MIMSFVAISDRNVGRLLADPPLVWKVISPEDDSFYEETRGGKEVVLWEAVW